MRFPRFAYALGIALGLTMPACSDSEGPTSIEIPIATIRILGGCFMEEGASCSLSAEAKTSDGTIVSDPVLRWSSSATNVATVEGDGRTAVVHARALGSATIRAENTTGDAFDDTEVLVLPCSKC